MPQREQMLLPYLAVYIHDLSEYPQVCRYQINLMPALSWSVPSASVNRAKQYPAQMQEIIMAINVQIPSYPLLYIRVILYLFKNAGSHAVIN